MEKTALFITVILLATTCDGFFFNIDEKGHKKYVSDRNFFLEAQAKDSKFLCSVMVVSGYENSDINVFGFAPNIVYIYKFLQLLYTLFPCLKKCYESYTRYVFKGALM